MGLMFGTQDSFDCVAPQKFEGPNHDQVCLASKISLHFFGAGIYVSDGGYVLKVSGKEEYYSLTPANLKDLQSEHLIPDPLPPYHIEWYQYVFGYSLWLVILIAVVAMGLQRIFGKLRPFLADPVAPVSGPPVARTDGDKWLIAEFEKHLEPGERLQHLAMGTNFEPGTVVKGAKSIFVGLSDRRLMFMDGKVGFTGRPKAAENFSARPRSELMRVVQDQLHIFFVFTDGSAAPVWIFGRQGRYSNQWLFARDVPRLLQAELAGTAVKPGVQAVNA